MKEIKEYLHSKVGSFNSDQLKIFNEMQNDKILQICMPTGGGKNYIMMIDILNQIISTKSKVFTISSHRLMLNNQHMSDMFELFSPMIGEVGFIFVGSSKYNVSKFLDNPKFNKALLKKKLSYDEIISSATNKDGVNELVEKHLKKKRKVVILTTYHSLHTLKNLEIDTLFCDEAHTLASPEDGAQFKENFETVSASRKYFLTATPKDCVEDTESFLMNNIEVFGRRTGLTFKECIDKGYIVKPIMHIAVPSNLNFDLNFKSTANMVKFITDTFYAHKNWLNEVSFDPSKIAPKILIKCPSVDDMWKIHLALVGKMEGVKICSGASANKNSNFCHYIDSEGITGRSEYLERIQQFGENEMVIVLHYDTMSEGINVSGFTGVMFLGGKLPTTIKILQNTGRATRLHPLDRNRFRIDEIAVGDGKWIKGYCAVIIPYWDKESEFTTKELARQIKELRDNFEYASYIVSLGDDSGDGKNADDLDALNDKGDKEKKAEIIEEIKQEIEVLDKEELDLKESERINGMSVEEWFNFANNLN